MSKRLQTSARTTTSMRRVIQNSPESIRSLARRYGINPKTVTKWRQRSSVIDLKTGPKELRSTVLSVVEEATIVAFRRHVVLPLDHCLRTLQSVIPHLTRSSLHRCLQRHDISRQPPFASGLIAPGNTEEATVGRFLIGVTALRTAHSVFQLFVATELNSRFVYAAVHEGSGNKVDTDFLHALVKAAPCTVRLLVTPSPLLQNDAFMKSCAAHHIEYRHNKEHTWWNDMQLQRIEHTIGKAMDETSRADQASGFGRTISQLVSHYNRHCTPRLLHGLTPHECIEKLKKDPSIASIHRSPEYRDRISGLGSHTATTRGLQKTRARNRDNTRETILEAARSCLAHDGPEGLSMAEVARIAGVNRGTAYQHFQTREKLIAASSEWVSDKLFRAVFGEPGRVADQQVGEVDVAELIDRLSNFAMDNPELCRAWLLQVLSSPSPSSDAFWKQYAGSTRRFAATELAEDNIDAEVLSVIMLAGAFLWPVWARAHTRSKDNLRPLAHRFARECLRISMYGNLRSEHYPAIASRLRSYGKQLA